MTFRPTVVHLYPLPNSSNRTVCGLFVYGSFSLRLTQFRENVTCERCKDVMWGKRKEGAK